MSTETNSVYPNQNLKLYDSPTINVERNDIGTPYSGSNNLNIEVSNLDNKDIQKEGVINIHDEESRPFLNEEDMTINAYKNMKSIAEQSLGFSGLFAGFEGFIINTYVGQDLEDLQLELALFCLSISFLSNIFASIMSCIIMTYLKWGFARYWINGFVKLNFAMIIMALITFGIGFCLFFSKTKLRPELQIVIFVFFGVFSLLAVIFSIALLIGVRKDEKENEPRRQFILSKME